MVSQGKLGVIGVGVMGQALIQGLLKSGTVTPEQVWASARTEKTCHIVTKELGIQASPQYQPFLAGTDVILLCVKPKQALGVLESLKAAGLPKTTLVISIVAGTPIRKIGAALGGENPIIRAMPNTPCVVGEGMTVICPGTFASEAHLAKAQKIFESVGKVLVLEEHHFDAVTGLGGSGPAYLYLIMEALADGGVRVGLPREVALQMVSQVVLGAAKMVEKTGRHPAALRDDVTTPAGCTIAGLLTLEDGKIRSVLSRAVEEATQIAGQLGKSE